MVALTLSPLYWLRWWQWVQRVRRYGMPTKAYLTKADYDAEYQTLAERDGHPIDRPPVWVRYTRSVLWPGAQERAQRVASIMGWTAPGPVIVVVGAGFALLAEAWEAIGFTRVASVDISPYIQGAKTTSDEADVRAEIVAAGLDPDAGRGAAILAQWSDGGPKTRASRGVLNEDCNTQQSRNRVRQALGLSGNTQPDWLVSENVLDSLTDAEAQTDSARLKAWVPNLLHLVTCRHLPGTQDPDHNWHTLEEWAVLLPGDVLIDLRTWQRLP